jgi:hypothetical protein
MEVLQPLTTVHVQKMTDNLVEQRGHGEDAGSLQIESGRLASRCMADVQTRRTKQWNKGKIERRRGPGAYDPAAAA